MVVRSRNLGQVMGAQVVSQLEELLRTWKEDLLHHESVRPLDAAELELHVRDSVAQLSEKGLSDEEAFWVATKRLGYSAALGREFSKVNGGYVWTQRVFWMLAGFLLVHLWGMLASGIASLAQALAAASGGNGPVLSCVWVGLTVLSWIAILCWLGQLAGKGHAETLARWSSRVSPSIALLAYVMIFAMASLLRIAGRAAVARLTPVQTYGEVVLVSAYTSMALAVLVPLAVFLLMLSLRRRMQSALA